MKLLWLDIFSLIKICNNRLQGIYRPEGPEYFSPGQSLQRNDVNVAPGKKGVSKTVREGKLINSEIILRTERHIKNPIKTRFTSFRPKPRLIFEWLSSSDEFNTSSSTPGVARGYYNFPFQGNKRLESDINKKFILVLNENN